MFMRLTKKGFHLEHRKLEPQKPRLNRTSKTGYKNKFITDIIRKYKHGCWYVKFINVNYDLLEL